MLLNNKKKQSNKQMSTAGKSSYRVTQRRNSCDLQQAGLVYLTMLLEQLTSDNSTERYDQQRVVLDRQYHQSPDLKPRPPENREKVLTTPVVCVLIFCTEYQHIHISTTWHTKSLQHQI
jgi:hypothetical protein